MPIQKIDFKKKFKQFYNPKPIAQLTEVVGMQFLMIDGMGIAQSKDFSEAIEALFSVSYKAKFMAKESLNFDYTVMPLEGLWWADDMNDFITGNKDRWKWTLMIMQPEQITNQLIDEARAVVKKKSKLSILDNLRLEYFTEGKAAQMLHVGSFSEEHENIMKLHKLIEDSGGVLTGKHHEIYLSDFRKVEPSKMKTILRQPFKDLKQTECPII